MNYTEIDRDEILTNFLSDYIDKNLSSAERAAFEEYLAQNEDEKAFAQKAISGKKALSRLASQINMSSVNA